MSTTATYWPTSLKTTSVQVHTVADGKAVAKIPESRRIAYSVRGPALEVWEIRYGLLWARRNLPKLISGVREVWGGSASESSDFAQDGQSQENNLSKH